MMFISGEVLTRLGTSLNFDNVTSIVKIELFTRNGEATRLLILDSNGDLYDSTSLAPILSIPTMTDFRMKTFNNRAFITPVDKDNEIGLSGNFLYIYDGSGSARKAAGTAPTGTITIAASGLSGNVEAGFHLFAIAYETASGFITKPGPAIYGVIDADGTHKVAITGIPTGPSGTAKRHILATKSITLYDFNQFGYEFFFVPDGLIEDNTTTSATVNFFDADLLESSEYLLDQFEEIPATTGLTEYKGRLVLWNNSFVYISKPGEPESIDALSGLAAVGLGETGNITDCIEYRDMFYVNKKYRTFVGSDNGGDPSTWQFPSLDKGMGSPTQGIIHILDSHGVSVDKFLVAHFKGLVLFNGLYQEPEVSWKIESLWNRINKNKFELVHGCNDTKNHSIYIAVPLDNAEECSHILHCDYKDGLDAGNVRWSIWSSAEWTNPTSILIDLNQDVPFLRIGSSQGVFDQDTSSRVDEDQAITSQIKTAYVPVLPGYIGHYSAVRIRGSGSGTLETTLYSEDDVKSEALADTTLSTTPGNDYTRLANFQNEKCAINLSCVSFGDYFSVRRLDLFAKVLWSEYPR